MKTITKCLGAATRVRATLYESYQYTYRTQKVTEKLNYHDLSMHVDFFLLFGVIKAGLYMHDEPYCTDMHGLCVVLYGVVIQAK